MEATTQGRARGTSTVSAWLRRVARDLDMELEENDNTSLRAVLQEIDRRLALADGK